MNDDRAMLSKAITGRQLDELVSQGIEDYHFGDEECARVYRFMRGHMAEYAEPPSSIVVQEQFPDFAFETVPDGIDYLISRFRKAVNRREAIKLGRDYMSAIDNPDQIGSIELVAMEMASALMDILPSPTVGRFSDAENDIETYLRDQAMGVPKGMATGFPTIDHAIVGLQPHEFAVVAGWQNSGKSLIMQRIALNLYQQINKTALYISLEMSKQECYGRWYSMAAELEHRALRAMEITEGSPEFARWREVAREAREFEAEKNIICVDDIGSCTPDRVLVETRRYKPDVVFVDYLELMDPPRQSESQWQGIDQIGRQLKRNARMPVDGKHIPVVVGAQTSGDDGGRGAQLDNISYKSTGKHADLVLGITRTEEMVAEKRLQLTVLKNRNGKRGVVSDVRCDPEIMSVYESGLGQTARRHRTGDAFRADEEAEADPKPTAREMFQSFGARAAA